jgi:metal-responsive CopG/Arc/MetJ family transcriptional regulator
MRHKVSVSIEQDLILKINETMSKNRIFRSKSHVIEEALASYFENKHGGK